MFDRMGSIRKEKEKLTADGKRINRKSPKPRTGGSVRMDIDARVEKVLPANKRKGRGGKKQKTGEKDEA